MSSSQQLGDGGLSSEGEERFNEVYDKAVLRKKLFKEYLTRHQVIERFNKSLEALYECGQLPDDPMPFLMDQLKVAPKLAARQARPTSATFKRN